MKLPTDRPLTDRELEEFLRRYDKASRAAGQRFMERINRAFYGFLWVHRRQGKSMAAAAQLAVDDLNRAVRGDWQEPSK